MNVKQEDWERSPQISPIIWRTMKNQTRAVDMLRFSREENCVKFLKVYDTLTKDEKEMLPLEIPCLAAGVSPAHILGQVILMARDASQAESALVVMMESPDVLRSSAAFGTALPNNARDREIILKAAGTIPTPTGPSINVKVFTNKDESDDEEDDGMEGGVFLEGDVFDHDTKAINDWGESRRKLLDKDKSK